MVFKIPGFVYKYFLTFLSHPLPTLLLAPFLMRSWTLVSCSLLQIHTEPLTMQANVVVVFGRAVAHKYYSNIYVLKCQGVDCKQSIISLNIHQVLRHGAFGKENTLSQKGSGPLAACAFYPSYFEENKRLLAVYQSVGHKTVKEVWNFGSMVVW